MPLMMPMAAPATAPAIVSPTLFDDVDRRLTSGDYAGGLELLCATLTDLRESMPPAEWKAFCEESRRDPIAELVLQDPLTRRALRKPRGYAGDAVMMDYIYGIHEYRLAFARATDLGRGVLTALRNRPACSAVRSRRERIARTIDVLAAGIDRPDVLAIAAGHLREAEDTLAVRGRRTGRVVALDADAESLWEVSTRYERYGVSTLHASVRHLLARRIHEPPFDLVYAAGLFDYLTDPIAAALAARMFELTKPGGRVVIPNFSPTCADRAYLEAFMDWNLIYRDECAMAKLVEGLPSAAIASYEIAGDVERSIVYLTIHKAG